MVLRTEDPGLPGAADRLGRRIFSGLLVATLVGSAVYLMKGQEHETLAITLFVIAGVIWLAHVARDLRRGAKKAP
jgi:ubiquinone biosynthesis protein